MTATPPPSSPPASSVAVETSNDSPASTVREKTCVWPGGMKLGGKGKASATDSSADERKCAFTSPPMWKRRVAAGASSAGAAGGAAPASTGSSCAAAAPVSNRRASRDAPARGVAFIGGPFSQGLVAGRDGAQ